MIVVRRALYLLVVVGLTIALAPTATAQTTEPDAAQADPDTEDPVDDDPTADDDAPADPDPMEFDLTGVVVVGPDGSVQWNVENSNDAAVEPTPTPAPSPTATASPTAEPVEADPADVEDTELDGQGAGAGSGDGEPPAPANVSGPGQNLPMLLGVGGGALALMIALAVVLRSRRKSTDSSGVADDLLNPLAPMSGEFPQIERDPGYIAAQDGGAYEPAGAQDGGAYEPAGAAYAQRVEANVPFGNPSNIQAANLPTNAGPMDARPTGDGLGVDGFGGDGLLGVGVSGAGLMADDMMVGPSESKLDQLRASMESVAERGLAESGADQALAKKLEAAGSKMRAGEWLLLVVASTCGALFAGAFVLSWIVGGIAAVLVALGFWMGLGRMEKKRHKLFAEALPETLGLLAGSLRGGFSMLQAIGTVAEEADEPTAEEFQRIVSETRLGRDTAVALRDMAVRMDSKDFEWVATAIEIHREVGGDLAKILDRVGNTIRSRNRVQGQVKALSAEGRASGMLLFLLPPGMVAVIAASNRPYIDQLINTQEGQIMLGAATVLLLMGGFWLKRLSRFVY